MMTVSSHIKKAPHMTMYTEPIAGNLYRRGETVCPAVILKGEVVMAPRELAPYQYAMCRMTPALHENYSSEIFSLPQYRFKTVRT